MILRLDNTEMGGSETIIVCSIRKVAFVINCTWKYLSPRGHVALNN